MSTTIIDVLKIQGGANQRVADVEDVRGAFGVVLDTTARDAIPTACLRTGAVLRMDNSSTYYEWNGSAWILFTGFGGGGGATAIDWKDSVRFATTTALAASTRVTNTRTANANGAFPAVDGVTAAVGNRFLDKDNATGVDRGLWQISSLGSGGAPWVITRTGDADSSSEVTSGMGMVVTEGTANGGKIFLLTTADPITLNTTSLTFAALSGGGVTAGNGLTGTTTLSVLPEDTTITVGAGGVKRPAISGDVTIAAGSNVAAITADVIVNADINTAAALAWSKFAAAIGNVGFTGAKYFQYTQTDDSSLGATPTIDWSASSDHKGVLSANCAPTFTAPAVARIPLRLTLTQDATGGRTFTQPGSVVVRGATPYIDPTPGAVTVLDYEYDGANYILQGDIPSRLSPRGTTNVAIDLYPSIDQKSALAATTGSIVVDFPMVAGKYYDITWRIAVNNGTGGALVFREIDLVCASLVSGAATIHKTDLSSQLALSGVAVAFTVSTTNARMTLTNSTGTAYKAAIQAGAVISDLPT